MINYNFQLNNSYNTKTLNEMIEENFSNKKEGLDVSFFYNEKENNEKKDLNKNIKEKSNNLNIINN